MLAGVADNIEFHRVQPHRLLLDSPHRCAAPAEVTQSMQARQPATEPLILLAITAAVLAWSAIRPFDHLTWLLEVAPVLIAAPILVLTFQTRPLSPLLYRLILLHAVILIVGGHYTYARVPAGFWLQDALELSRNHYDRLGHLAQGFVPAILAREILLRATPLRRGGWLNLLIISVCLAFSALYELIEMAAALISAEAAESFLGTQGDNWDTQWDMLMALTGAIAAVALLSRAHDRSMAAVGIRC
jgi:putative membrane protein